jgi:hypothetical protein
MAKKTGYAVLILSCLIWGVIFIIPFLDLGGGKKAGIITGLIIAGEITFYLGIALLGKTIYEKLKSRLKFWKKPESVENEDTNGKNE